MLEQSLTMAKTMSEPNEQVPDFYILPTLPSDRSSAFVTYQQIEAKMIVVRELLDQVDQNDCYAWLRTLLDRYDSLALAYDAYASLNDAQAQKIVARLDGQLKRLQDYFETAPEDLWPRGP